MREALWVIALLAELFMERKSNEVKGQQLLVKCYVYIPSERKGMKEGRSLILINGAHYPFYYRKQIQKMFFWLLSKIFFQFHSDNYCHCHVVRCKISNGSLTTISDLGQLRGTSQFDLLFEEMRENVHSWLCSIGIVIIEMAGGSNVRGIIPFGDRSNWLSTKVTIWICHVMSTTADFLHHSLHLC